MITLVILSIIFEFFWKYRDSNPGEFSVIGLSNFGQNCQKFLLEHPTRRALSSDKTVNSFKMVVHEKMF